MTLDQEKLAQAMTIQGYIDQIKVNKQPFMDIYQGTEVPEDVKGQFDALDEPLNVVVFTADWCGDAMSTTPAVFRLIEASDKLSAQVFNRDDELELTNSFMAENRAGTVPVFIVLTPSGEEIARFIETAHSLVPAIDAMDEEIARAAENESADNARAAVRGKRTAFRVDHAREWGEVIIREFGSVVAEGLASSADQRPAVGGTRWPQDA